MIDHGKFYVWDNWTDYDAPIPANIHAATGRPDKAMQLKCKFNSPVNGAYAGYHTLVDLVDKYRALIFDTAYYFPKPTVSLRVWHEPVSSARYSDKVWRDVLNDQYLSLWNTVIQKWPTDVAGFISLDHETDNYAYGRVHTPDLYRLAMQHQVATIVNLAEMYGKTENIQVGALLTGAAVDEGMDSPHAWYRGLNKYLQGHPSVMVPWDTYFHYRKVEDGTYTWEDHAAKIKRHTDVFLEAGIPNHFLAETAQSDRYRHDRTMIVGDQRGQIAHIKALEAWVTDPARPGTRVAGLFSKADGPESMYGSITRPDRQGALAEAGYTSKRVNRP